MLLSNVLDIKGTSVRECESGDFFGFEGNKTRFWVHYKV